MPCQTLELLIFWDKIFGFFVFQFVKTYGELEIFGKTTFSQGFSTFSIQSSLKLGLEYYIDADKKQVSKPLAREIK